MLDLQKCNIPNVSRALVELNLKNLKHRKCILDSEGKGASGFTMNFYLNIFIKYYKIFILYKHECKTNRFLIRFEK